MRAGLFKDVDVVALHARRQQPRRQLGRGGGTGLVSVEYTFDGRERARGGAPVARPLGARRRRADGHRLELSAANTCACSSARTTSSPTAAISRTSCRTNASVWYYFRETDYEHIKELREIGDTMAQGAALMTEHRGDVAHARVGVAAAHQQAGRRDDVREHQGGRAADVGRGGLRRSRRGCRRS